MDVDRSAPERQAAHAANVLCSSHGRSNGRALASSGVIGYTDDGCTAHGDVPPPFNPAQKNRAGGVVCRLITALKQKRVTQIY